MGERRILVVEDELVVAREIQATLRELGYTVVDLVAWGEEAVEKTAEHNPDLVLMDVVLKGEMDGIQAAEQIHSQHSIPVVYLTAYTDENTMQRAKISEPYAYIVKPFKERELYSTIEIALDKHEADQQKHRVHVELEEKNRELEHFAYIVSHDLQEPLRMVSSYMKLIEKRYHDVLDDDGKEFIYYAADGSRRMQELLNDLLTYCRISARGEPFQLVDYNAVLRSATVMLDLAIQDANAEITWDEMPQVMADESQLVQLFQNLIANAIKYRRDEPPRIHISAEERNNEWLFSIEDNGMGIEPQYQDQVFLIFQRLHNKDKTDGTGVGLAVCKKIVERHGGQIWLESEPGQGTTFYFTMPNTAHNNEE